MATRGSPTTSNGNGHTPTNGTAMATVGAAPIPSDALSGEFNFIQALNSLQLDAGDTELHPRQDPGIAQASDQQVTLNTNVYGLKSDSVPVYQYHLDLQKEFQVAGNGLKKFPLIPVKKDDGSAIKFPDFSTFENRKIHRALVDALIAKYPDVFGPDPNVFLYDFANTLFSLKELNLTRKDLVLNDQEVLSLVKRSFTLHCEVKDAKKFASRDFQSNFSANLQDHQNEIIRFLELATSRYASLHPEEHVMFESKTTSFMHPENYRMRSADLGGGKYLNPGACKTVQLVQGPKGNGSPAVVIDSKKTPFYASMNLLQMIIEGLKFDPKREMSEATYAGAEKYMKGLEVFPIYGSRQQSPITLKGFALGNAENNFFEFNGEKVSVTQYFRRRYEIDLAFPYLPLVEGAKSVRGEHPKYPIELLWVADNQRVKNSNITSTDIATIVRSCAVAPLIKSTEIANCHASFAFQQDAFLAAATIQVLNEPLQAQARILKPPNVKYANGPEVAPAQNGKWRIARDAKFLHATRLPKWSAVLLNYSRDSFSFQSFQDFVKMFEQEMRNRGIQFEPLAPHDILQIDADENAIAQIFMDSDETNYRFLLFGHPDKETHLHSFIKGMERKFDVVSQCVRTKTINNILQRKMLSLENIVAKTNVKLGGINYNCLIQGTPLDQNILFIGLGMNHPGGGLGTSPNQLNADTNGKFSVLGFAANDGKIPNEFIGNFFLQPVNQDEKVTVLDSLVQEVMERFVKNRGHPPSRVIFYRNGISEASFIKVLRYEVPIIRTMIRDLAPEAKVSIIIPSKMHSVRLFNTQINPGAKADEQNIRPGTVVDTGIVSMAFSEFYLNSHLALQGTAKSTKYTILYTDEEGVSLDQFERWTNALAYDFQIVSSPTSLPAPVYIAQRYSERGRQILNTFHTSEQANREKELEPEKKDSPRASTAVNGNGAHHTNGNGSNAAANGNGLTGGKVVMGHTRGQLSAHYQRSLHFNFTKRNLRNKRVNA